MAAPYKRINSDDSFEFVDQTDLLHVRLTGDHRRKHVIPGKEAQTGDQKQPLSPVSQRTTPLTLKAFQQLLDGDGRLVDESALRKTVFLGGIEPSARREVWQYLFSLYPCNSTQREREVLLLDYIVKYSEMKSHWKSLLKQHSTPGASELEQGLVAKYQVPEQDTLAPASTENCCNQSNNGEPDKADGPHLNSTSCQNESNTQNNHQGMNKESDLVRLSKHCNFIDLNNEETRQKVAFMKIQAQVYVSRNRIDVGALRSCLRLIDKDVPRTDRDTEYFRSSDTPTLTILREILITFSGFTPDVGYAQGMNDILARFLFVFDSEVEAYWCFHNYLEKIKIDFQEEGMINKIELVRKLLLEMDKPLLEHLENHELGDLLFCHRWLLLGFKREFSFLDSLRVFEILSSHHLELSSVEAEKVKRKQTMKEFADIGGVTRTTPRETDAEFTFELFMCVAMLQECRPALFKCTDAAMVFQVINNLAINLDVVLEHSERLFFRYCKKSVEDSFQLVDTPGKKHRR
ncbi:TBC1 domain family member 15-like [Mya arenaria]|uniref:TBC1 domain family member 15-like n=1 Tax=Mya arenaria TaxID=6604 RepID=UPI0022DE9A6C|nr:TBC1 domain family member 15-like [Mya arenaria]